MLPCLGHAGDINGLEELGALVLLFELGEGRELGEGLKVFEGIVGVGAIPELRRLPTGTRVMVLLLSLLMPNPLGSSSMLSKCTAVADNGDVY